MTEPQPSTPTRGPWPARLLSAITAGYMAALVWATHHPKPLDLLGEHPPSDKLMHVGAYTVLGGLLAATLGAAGRLSLLGGLRAAAALAAFGALDEVTQPLPWFGRTADPFDWLCDLAGIALGIAAVAAAARGLRGRGPRGQ